MADTDAPRGARVRAATALMDRAGLTPTYAVQVRHRDDQHALETTEFQDPEVMARQILAALPQVIAMLPPTEVRAVLQRVEGTVLSCGPGGSDAGTVLADVGDSAGCRLWRE